MTNTRIIRDASVTDKRAVARRYLLVNSTPGLKKPSTRADQKTGRTLRNAATVMWSSKLIASQVPDQVNMELLKRIEQLISGKVSLVKMAGEIGAAAAGSNAQGNVPNTGTASDGTLAGDIAFLINSDKFDAQDKEYGDLIHTALEDPNYIDHRVIKSLRKMIEAGGFSIYLWCLRAGHNENVSGKGSYSHHTYGCAVDIGECPMGTPVAHSPSGSEAHKLATWCFTDLKDELEPDQIGSRAVWNPDPKTAAGANANSASWFTAGEDTMIHIGWKPPEGKGIIGSGTAMNLPHYTKAEAKERVKEIDVSDDNGSGQIPKEKRKGVIIHFTESDDVPATTVDQWHQGMGFTPRGTYELKFIGYNMVSRRDGTLEVGRDPTVLGEHAHGCNTDYLSICLTGSDNLDWYPAAEQIYKAAKQICIWKFQDGFTSLNLNEIWGHHDASFADSRNAEKSCPGNNFYSKIGSIYAGLRLLKFPTFTGSTIVDTSWAGWPFRMLLEAIAQKEFGQTWG